MKSMAIDANTPSFLIFIITKRIKKTEIKSIF